MSSSLGDIAARSGTSIGAVSVTLNGARSKTLRVGTEARARILKAADELGYRRNPLARALRTGRNHVLGLMLPHADDYAQNDPFYTLVLTGVSGYASQRGYNVMLYSAVAEDAGERAAAMIDKRVDGLVLVLPPNDSPIYDECARQEIPVVSIVAPTNLGQYSVNSDDYLSGLLATRHLLDLGHRRIAHLEGHPSFESSAPRKRAYHDALKAAGIESEPEMIVPGSFNRLTSYDSTRKLMELPQSRRPTAIFAANDLSAHGVIDAVHDGGLQVPEDVAVVGCDDTWYATVTRPMLTSVRTDVAGLGERAAKLLVSHLEGEVIEDSHPVLPVSLTVRESCGANRPPRTDPV